MEIETQIERQKKHVNFQHTFNSLSVLSLVLSNAVALPFPCRSALACFLACGSLVSLMRHADALMTVMRLTCMETYLHPIYF